MTEETEDRRAASADEVSEFSKLFVAAGATAQRRIVELAGADFLAGLLADPQGEIIVQLALKAGLARIQVFWPQFSPEVQTLSEFQPHRDRGLAS